MVPKAALLFALITLLLPRTASGADAAKNTASALPPQAIQDPSTKVIFYLESDQRHFAAISAEGKVIWCKEIVKHSGAITSFQIVPNPRSGGEKCIRINLWEKMERPEGHFLISEKDGSFIGEMIL